MISQVIGNSGDAAMVPARGRPRVTGVAVFEPAEDPAAAPEDAGDEEEEDAASAGDAAPAAACSPADEAAALPAGDCGSSLL
jgi:hypothetical protein